VGEAEALSRGGLKMQRRIEKVAVLGAGIMGSGIAAQLAGAGIPCLMLDIVPPEFTAEDQKAGLTQNDKRFRNKFALKGLEAIQKSKPALIYHKKYLPLIEVGNFEDDFDRLKECDWVIEVVVERLDIKQKLFERVEKTVRPGTIVSSNTSGLPIKDMTKGRSEAFQKNFLVTHFFNPVRYMHLLELVPGEKTDPAILSFIADFGRFRLGKGIVYGKDTPNFVGNRIGVFGMMVTLHAALQMGYRFDEVDAITGPALGRPKSASFGTADLVGLDTFIHVVNTLKEGCPDDEGKWAFEIPEVLDRMVKNGMLGRKSKKGFFTVKKDSGKKETFVLDPKTFEYLPQEKPDIESLKKVKGIHDPGQRIKIVANATDRAGIFAWKILKDTLAYSANRMGEIADTIVDIDQAIKWGFNWELGPFETWDALGVKETVERMEAEGVQVAKWVKEMLKAGCLSFYRDGATCREYYDVKAKKYLPIPKPESFLILADIKRQKPPVYETMGASLVDIGDGIACVEFHSATQPTMNPIDDSIIEVMLKGIEVAEKDFRGLVIHHQAPQFCAGANIAMLLEASRAKMWDAIDKMVRDFQAMTLGLRKCKVPTVTAPFGFTFGGGAEITMGGDRVCAHAETYMGLIEVGVGLLPAGGGHLFMLERVLAGIDTPILSNLPFLQKAFETIAMAKVSTSAEEARSLKYLRPFDKVEICREQQLYTAKRMAIAMAEEGYVPPLPMSFHLPGKEGVATFKMILHNMKQTHWVTAHDVKIATHIANILCGGDTTIHNPVSEQKILDLEREAFLSLCGEEKTQARIQHMLERGKPLRN
jgi:3-hydroxyacyl-CoA dehydrogenase